MLGDGTRGLQLPRNQVRTAVAAMVLVGALTPFIGPLVLVVAALPLAFALAVSLPTIWILAFLALSQYRIPDAFPALHALHLPLAFGAMAMAAVVWHVAIARTIRIAWPRPLVMMLALFAIAAMSLVLAVDREASTTFFLDTYWKIIAVGFALAWMIRREVDFVNVAVVTLVSGLLIGLVAAYNKIYGIDLVEGTRVGIGSAMHSPLADPNDLALALMCPLSFALAMLVHRPSRTLTLLAAVTAALALAGIVFTQSRGGLLAVLAGLAVIGLHFVRSRNALVLLLVIAGLVLFAVMGIAARKSGGFAELEDGIDQSSYLRTVAWKAAVNMAIHRPFTGVGIGSFTTAFYFYSPELVGRDLAPHSTWFGMLGEMGVPGFVVLVVMVVGALSTVRAAKRTLELTNGSRRMQAFALGLQGSIVTFCVAGSFLGQHTSWPLYTLVALAVALGLHVDERTGKAAAAASGTRGTPAGPRLAMPSLPSA